MSMKISENQTVRNAGLAAAVGASIGTINNYITQDYILKNPQKMLDSYDKAISNVASRKTDSDTIRKIYQATVESLSEAKQEAQELIKSGKINNKNLREMAIGGALAGVTIYGLYRGIKSLITPKNK